MIDAGSFPAFNIDTTPTVANIAKNGMPINLPWFPKSILLGTTLHSSRLHSANPWGRSSPFDAESLHNAQLRFDIKHGSDGSYVSATTTTSGQTLDHLSLSLGIEVDMLFAGASVVGSYDQATKANNSGLKSSIRSKFMRGTLIFDKPPRLSMAALIALKHPAVKGVGLEEFQDEFGDYYVAGYRLGGESGMLLSQSTKSNSVTEKKALEAKVRFLCFSKTHREEWTTEDKTSESAFDLAAYDTLDHVKWPPSPGEDSHDAVRLGTRAKEYGTRVRSLDSRVMAAVENLNLDLSTLVGLDSCQKVCESGLVMELILLPTRYLREVMIWATNDNII